MAKNKKTKATKKKGHNVLKGIGYTILLFMFLGILAVGIGATVFFIYIASTAPSFDENKLYTTEPSVIYDVNGAVIANIGTQDRQLLSYDELPEVLVNAIVATEDARFFQHNGVDLPRFIVAAVQQLMGRDEAGGASTLTMQLSKNNYTSKNAHGWEGIKRKFWDVYISVFKIEPTYSKEEILEFYTNSQFLGAGYGVEVVSRNYFGKSAKDLNVAEAAMIAGLFQAPSKYNPYTNPEATEDRRQIVLSLMKRHSYITEEEYNIAKEMTVQKIVKEKSNSVDIASGLVNSDYQLFVDMVIQDVQAKTGESPYTTGMEIYTTLDPKLQKHVSNIFNGKTYKWANKKVQGGVAVVDVKTGAIAAIGGGRNVSSATSYNRAIHIKRQIGSTAKPLYDYGPAIEYLNWNTGTIIADDKTTYSDGTAIHNWDGSYTGYQTIEQHLKVSRNIPALKTFKAVPKADIIKFVTGLGLTPEIYSCDSNYKLSGKKCINKENANDVVDAKQATTLHEAHSIGGYNGESPLTMAAAYAAFGNGGYYNEPYSFTKVVHTDTGDTYFNKPARRQVMSDSTAYMITHMLQETAAYGIDSGSYKNVNGIRYAAKTGTTNFDDATKRKNKLPGNAINDYWVIGYNTEYAIGVWYGYDSIKDGYQVLGGSQHQRLFQAVAQGVFKSKADFPMPSSVVKVVTEKDTATSLLPSAATPSSYKVTSLFISGTEPNKVSTRFDSLSNISNLNAENNGDGTITVSWSGIGTPNVFDVSYVASNLSKQGLPTTNLNSYASSIVSRNKKFFGSVGYRVYVEENGTLVDKGFTPNNSITVSTTNGTHKVTVKAAYSNYSGCMSSGRTTSVTVTGSGSFEPEPTEPEQPTTDDSNKTSNSNSNITRP